MTKVSLAAIAAAAFAGCMTHAAELQGTVRVLSHTSLEELHQRASRAPAPDAVDPLSIYSNITDLATPLGSFGQAGAAPVGATGAFITFMWMDDLQFTTNPGVGLVTTVRFAVYNNVGSPTTARALLRFWHADRPGGLPGTYYAPAIPGGPLGITVAPFAYPPGVSFVSVAVPGGGFSVPAGTTTRLWAGIAFDSENGSGGNTGMTQNQMNGIRQTFFNTVDRGSSQDMMYATDVAESFLGVDNPFGHASTAPAGMLANLGWELVVSTLPVELQGFSIE